MSTGSFNTGASLDTLPLRFGRKVNRDQRHLSESDNLSPLPIMRASSALGVETSTGISGQSTSSMNYNMQDTKGKGKQCASPMPVRARSSQLSPPSPEDWFPVLPPLNARIGQSSGTTLDATAARTTQEARNRNANISSTMHNTLTALSSTGSSSRSAQLSMSSSTPWRPPQLSMARSPLSPLTVASNSEELRTSLNMQSAQASSEARAHTRPKQQQQFCSPAKIWEKTAPQPSWMQKPFRSDSRNKTVTRRQIVQVSSVPKAQQSPKLPSAQPEPHNMTMDTSQSLLTPAAQTPEYSSPALLNAVNDEASRVESNTSNVDIGLSSHRTQLTQSSIGTTVQTAQTSVAQNPIADLELLSEVASSADRLDKPSHLVTPNLQNLSSRDTEPTLQPSCGTTAAQTSVEPISAIVEHNPKPLSQSLDHDTEMFETGAQSPTASTPLPSTVQPWSGTTAAQIPLGQVPVAVENDPQPASLSLDQDFKMLETDARSPRPSRVETALPVASTSDRAETDPHSPRGTPTLQNLSLDDTQATPQPLSGTIAAQTSAGQIPVVVDHDPQLSSQSLSQSLDQGSKVLETGARLLTPPTPLPLALQPSTATSSAETSEGQINVAAQYSPRPLSQSLDQADANAKMLETDTCSPRPSTAPTPLPSMASNAAAGTVSEPIRISWAPTRSAFWSYNQSALRSFAETVSQNTDFEAEMMDIVAKTIMEPVVPVSTNMLASKAVEDVEMTDEVYEPQPWETSSTPPSILIMTSETAMPTGQDSDLQDSPMTDIPPSIPELDYNLATTVDVDMQDVPASIVPNNSTSLSSMLSASLRNGQSSPMLPQPTILPSATQKNTLPTPVVVPVGNFNIFSSVSTPSAPAVVVVPTTFNPTLLATTNMSAKMPPVVKPEASTSRPILQQPPVVPTPVPSELIVPIFSALLATSQDTYQHTSAPTGVTSGFNDAYSARLPPCLRWTDDNHYTRAYNRVNAPPTSPMPEKTIGFSELVNQWRKLVSAPIGQFEMLDLQKIGRGNFTRCTALTLGAKHFRTLTREPANPPKPVVSKPWFSFSKILSFFGF